MERTVQQARELETEDIDCVPNNSGIFAGTVYVPGEAVIIGHVKITNNNAPSSETQSSNAVGSSNDILVVKISDYDPERVLLNVAQPRCPGTNQWIVQHKQYLQWSRRASAQRCLWLTGSIGTGKSLLAAAITQHLQRTCRENDEPVIHFFFRPEEEDFLTASALLNSIILQISKHLQKEDRAEMITTEVKEWMRRIYGPDNQEHAASLDEVRDRILMPLCSVLGAATFIVDGVDLCTRPEASQVLNIFRSLLDNHTAVRVMIASREDLDVASSIAKTSTITVGVKDVRSDIKAFIDWRIEGKMRERKITDRENTIKHIKKTLLSEAEGMILWVNLQIDAIWEVGSGDAQILEAFKRLPKLLEKIYEQCLQRIEPKQIHLTVKALAWIFLAKCSFHVQQLREALAVKISSGIIDQDQIPSSQDLFRSCGNLVTKDAHHIVSLSHSSVYQYLITKGKDILSALSKSQWCLRQANEDLGLLCIRYLACFEHASTRQPPTAATIIRRHLQPSRRQPSRTNTNDHSILRLHPVVPSRLREDPPPSFFAFACHQWHESSRTFSKKCIDQEDYLQMSHLALTFNVRSEIRPWQLIGEACGSNEAGLLGWSIFNDHEPLFSIMVDNQAWNRTPQCFLSTPLALLGGLNLLQLAVRSQNKKYFDILWQQSRLVDLDAEDTHGRCLLWHAVDQQRRPVIVKLVRRGAKITNASTTNSPLTLAVEQGSIDIVNDLLLKQKDPPGAQQEAVNAAIISGQNHILQWFLDTIQPQGHRLKLDLKLVKKAVRFGFGRVVSTILSHSSCFVHELPNKWPKVAVSAAEMEDNCTLLVIWKSGILDPTGYSSVLQRIISKGYSSVARELVSFLDGEEVTTVLSSALVEAASRDDELTVMFIRDIDSKICSGADTEDGAVCTAIACGSSKVFPILLDMEAPADADNQPSQHPSFLASAVPLAIEYKRIKMADQLLQRYGSPGVFWMKMLHKAIENNCPEIVELFCEHRLAIWTNDSRGHTSLMVAIKYRQSSCAVLLARYGVSTGYPEHRDHVLATLNYNEAHKAWLTLMQALTRFLSTSTTLGTVHAKSELPPIDFQMIPNILQEVIQGKTILHQAILNKDIALMKWLVGLGADVNICTSGPGRDRSESEVKQESSPLHLAVLMKSEEMANVLLDCQDINLSLEDQKGRTAFMMAIQTFQPHIAQIIQEKALQHAVVERCKG